jgi:hypothetical protein
MLVGLNYPWFDYGWDFGAGPPVWRGPRTTPRWYDDVDAHLRRFHDLHVHVVRWFILADGLTYGDGAAAPRPDPDRPGQWRFNPPPLDDAFAEHFRELLVRFDRFNRGGSTPVLLLPVLIDFEFCNAGRHEVPVRDPTGPLRPPKDPGWVKCGRADVLVDPSKRTRFFDRVFDVLLTISREHREVIYAWEVMNEPDWITASWDPNGRRNLPVDAASMVAFLTEGQRRIRDAGFKSTIGFSRIETLTRSGLTADINQFHHYPAGRRSLPRHVFSPEFPAIIGEFATAESDVWPDLPSSDQSVLARLRRVEAQGYPLAMPWSFLTHDSHTAWSARVEQDLRAFADR